MAQLFPVPFWEGGGSNLFDSHRKEKKKIILTITYHQQSEHPNKVHGIILCQLLYTILASPFITSIFFKGE